MLLFSNTTAYAAPTGAHPRAFLRPDIVAVWQAMASDATSPVARAIDRCDEAHDDPSLYESGDYQGFAWVEALTACLVAFETTGSAVHRDTAIVYLGALLSDESTVGDAQGPAYDPAFGIVAQDSGYSMRTHGVFAALGYDWLHDHLSPSMRAIAHDRFLHWIAFHHDTDTYQRANPGANYHAGHVLAMTLIAIGHADEMNAISAGTGDTLWNYVVGEMWGQVMANGHGVRGALVGGDWLEGWQYGPLSVASYSLAGRAIVEQGVSVPWLAEWNAAVLDRFVHGLSPDDRSFVGGDTEDETPMLDPNVLPLYGVIAGSVATDVRARARGEIARLAVPRASDFRLFHEALAAGEPGTASSIDRQSLPTGYFARGSGNYYGRTAHAPSATWFVSQCRGTVVDHQHQNAGNVVLSRGADALLVDPGPYGSLSTLTGNGPTMDQPHFDATYRPSQGAFGEFWGDERVPSGESTRMLFARSTPSGVHATRCDYTGQFRFRDVGSSILTSATRDVVLLPGDAGASMLIVDRAATTSAYANQPLAIRFHGASAWSMSGSSATSRAGDARLAIRRVLGTTTSSTKAAPVGDCSGDRGKCEAARFASSVFAASIRGPNPFAVHLLDGDATTATLPPVDAQSTGVTRVVELHRETRRFVVASTSDASEIAEYRASAEPSTHVVLDPPAGDRVGVTATMTPDGCLVSLAPSSSGFASNPLVFALDSNCSASDDTENPPRVPLPTPEESGPHDGGCGCGLAGIRRSPPLGLALLVLALLMRRARHADA